MLHHVLSSLSLTDCIITATEDVQHSASLDLGVGGGRRHDNNHHEHGDPHNNNGDYESEKYNTIPRSEEAHTAYRAALQQELHNMQQHGAAPRRAHSVSHQQGLQCEQRESQSQQQQYSWQHITQLYL